MDRRGRITQLRISGMRVIEDVTLELGGLTVLIGDNGTGKSTILEALELLRLASHPGSLVRDVISSRHGGIDALLRRGAEKLSLGCRLRSAEGISIDYGFTIRVKGARPFIDEESARVLEPDRGDAALAAFARDAQSGVSSQEAPVRFEDDELALSKASTESPLLSLIGTILGRTGLRTPREIEPARRLSRYGANLASAFQELRNRGPNVWERVLADARLGLRSDLTDLRIEPTSRGEVALELIFGNAADRPLPVEYLSEGQIAYLAMIALCALSESSSSLLALDEPEMHLHPGLLARVVFMLEDLAKTLPVVVSTHSDQLLDCLSDPAASVVLCDLDERGAARLRRPKKAALDRWLEGYRGVGSVRSEGVIEQLFEEPKGEKRAES